MLIISTEGTHNSTPTQYVCSQVDDFLQRSMFMDVQKSCKFEVNRLRNKDFISVELYWGLCPENAIFNIIKYFKLVKNRKR